MREFNTSFDFTVNDGALSSYLDDAPYTISGFKIRGDNITIIPEEDMLINEHENLQLYVNRYSEADQSLLLAPLLTETKLLEITTHYQKESAKFAAGNSVMMSQLGYDTAQKLAFVSKAVESFKDIKIHVEMYSYYVIWDMFDAVVRDEILTEERITTLKLSLYAKVFE